MTRSVHVLYTIEQDEDGVWCTHAQLKPGGRDSPGPPRRRCSEGNPAGILADVSMTVADLQKLL